MAERKTRGEARTGGQVFDRITFEPGKMGGRACIRGMRVTVGLLVSLVAEGLMWDEILSDYPYLEREDRRHVRSGFRRNRRDRPSSEDRCDTAPPEAGASVVFVGSAPGRDRRGGRCPENRRHRAGGGCSHPYTAAAAGGMSMAWQPELD